MNFMAKNIIAVSISIVLISGFIIFTRYHSMNPADFAKSAGSVNYTKNEKLQSNINSFMESQKSEYALGGDNYYCTNILYGYDDKYAYAWVLCIGYIVKDNGELEQGSGSSVPTRFEYNEPGLQITGFEQPGDGAAYNPSLKKLFPLQFFYNHPSNDEIDKLEKKIMNKVKAVVKIKEANPDLRGYPSLGLPPKSIKIEEDKNGLYLAFIKNGSGRPIIEARCFFARPDGTISESGKFTSSLADAGNLDFSAKECR